MLKSVIFDLDGLMVDSEPLQYRAYRDAFRFYDFELDLEQWARWHALEASPQRWVESSGLAIGVEELRARKKVIYDEMIANELQLKPGVNALVDELAGSYRLGIASGSRMESIVGCLERFSLRQHFEQLCPASEVARSKPYPDIYLDALRRLETRAENTLALEDSPSGLRAAIDAGIRCIVCPDEFIPKPEESWRGAALRVESLEQLDTARLEQVARGPYHAGDDI